MIALTACFWFCLGLLDGHMVQFHFFFLLVCQCHFGAGLEQLLANIALRSSIFLWSSLEQSEQHFHHWKFFCVKHVHNTMCQAGCFSPATGSRRKASKVDSSIAQALTHFSLLRQACLTVGCGKGTLKVTQLPRMQLSVKTDPHSQLLLAVPHYGPAAHMWPIPREPTHAIRTIIF
uniref:Putative secreted protein n=1 Tax=Rhipicephalus microplus TaxID=6941 RepID=A0A6G5A3A9_RHIMP